MVDRTCLSVKSGLAAKKLAVSPFCLENIYVAQFDLVETKSVCFDARLGFLEWAIGSHEPDESVTSFALLSYFYGMRRNEEKLWLNQNKDTNCIQEKKYCI